MHGDNGIGDNVTHIYRNNQEFLNRDTNNIPTNKLIDLVERNVIQIFTIYYKNKTNSSKLTIFSSKASHYRRVGHLHEILVYDRVIDSTERTAIYNYLNTKYTDGSAILSIKNGLESHLDARFVNGIQSYIYDKQYGLLHNIIPNSTNTQQRDTDDIANTFTNTNNAKLSNYANITLNNTKALSTVNISSDKSGIYTNGSLGVTHNVNIGDSTNNNGKIVLGASNIHSSGTNFNLDSDKHIFLNTTNSKPITITSDNNFTKSSGNNYTSLINTILTENVTGKSNIYVKIDNNDTYKSAVNTTVHQGLTSITTGFANLNIHQFNKITFKNDSGDIKNKSYTYVKNSITEGGIAYSIKNYINLIYIDILITVKNLIQVIKILQ